MKYIPLLKGKAGEFQALGELSATARANIQPLIEVVDIPWNFDIEDYGKTVDDHLNGVATKINGSWTGLPLFVDLPSSTWNEKMLDGSHPVTKVFSELSAAGALAIPVTASDRPIEYQEAIKAQLAADGRGVCLRLNPNNVAVEASLLIALLGVDHKDVDLIVDFNEILPEQADAMVLAFKGAVSGLNIHDWRSVTFAASSFPKDMGEWKSGDIAEIPRAEWLAWKKIHTTPGLESVNFGDYGIMSPHMVLVDYRVMHMSANIRYTGEESWTILRGSGVRRHPDGFGQFITLAQKLMGLPVYKGAGFSAGDKYIEDCAQGRTSGPGNAATWRKVGTNHHLTLAQSQVASS